MPMFLDILYMEYNFKKAIRGKLPCGHRPIPVRKDMNTIYTWYFVWF